MAKGSLLPAHARHPTDPELMAATEGELLRFAASSFPSVWALELLLVLKGDRRKWSQDELVACLRASDLVVTKALEGLIVAGLVSQEPDGAIYMPVSENDESCIEQLEQLYRARPNAVRRAIVSAATGGASAFADAFKLSKD